jgi:DNA-binding SARP family transcriptional activator
MEFRILGPFEVADGERALELGGGRQRALLALLVLHAGEVLSTDRLVDELWPERAPDTAAKIVQVYVSQLRKTLGREGVLVTRAPGYVVQLGEGALDLRRFEELVGDARHAEPVVKAAKLREALALWRGPALADFAYESFAQGEIARLEELRLGALEERIEADLVLGGAAELVPELERLVSSHPLRERPRAQLMLALYRAGRQADALETYREGRRLLDDELGLEPGDELQRLERAILVHDPALDAPAAGHPAQESALTAPERSILLVPRDPATLPALLRLAEPLAGVEPRRELILARLVDAGELASTTEALRVARADLHDRGVVARAATFTSRDLPADVVRLASAQEVDLLVLDDAGGALDGDLASVLADAPCDVAILVAAGGVPRVGPIVVPFGAAEHDWAALELGAWAARASGGDLRLVGAAEGSDGRDASRLLADASLIVQRTAGVLAEPLLASPGREGVAQLAEGAGLLVVGLSERWAQEGLGPVRSELAAAPPAPTVFVRRGLRPGGLAPAEGLTRFTWSLGGTSRG